MHNPDTHPNANPDTSGKGRRFVIQTHAVRPIRLDLNSDAALLWCRAQLSASEKDTASCSLVMRRAVRLYERFLFNLLNQPGALDAERRAVRSLSQMPGPKRRRPRPVKP